MLVGKIKHDRTLRGIAVVGDIWGKVNMQYLYLVPLACDDLAMISVRLCLS